MKRELEATKTKHERWRSWHFMLLTPPISTHISFPLACRSEVSLYRVEVDGHKQRIQFKFHINNTIIYLHEILRKFSAFFFFCTQIRFIPFFEALMCKLGAIPSSWWFIDAATTNAR